MAPGHPGRFASQRREEKKRRWVSRHLVCAPTTGEELIFPCAEQIARLHRQRTRRKPETVCQVANAKPRLPEPNPQSGPRA